MNPEKPARGELIRTGPDPGTATLAPAGTAARVVAVPRPGPAGPPQALAFTPIGLLRALRRRSTLAAGIALLLAMIGGPAAWFLVPPAPFRAQARLQIATQPPKVLFQTVDTQNGADYGRYQSTQQTLVKSRFVLSAALRDPKVARYRMIQQVQDPVEWLQEKLHVGFVSGSEVMDISLMGSDPEEVAGLVNAVQRAYMDEVVNFDRKKRVERYDQLKKIKDQYTEMLAKKRETMRKLAEAVGSDDRQTLALRQQYALDHLHYLQSELRDVQSQKRKLEVRLDTTRLAEAGEPAADPAPLSEQEIDRLVDRYPDIVDLTDQLHERQRRLDLQRARIRGLARNPSAADASVVSLDKDVKGFRQLLARRRQEVRPEVIRQARQQATLNAGLEGQDGSREMAMLVELEKRLNAEIESIKIVNHSLTTNTLDLQSHKDEAEQMELAATSVAREVEALTVELQAPPRIRLIDDATVPRTRDEKKRYMLVGMVTIGLFFGGLLGIAFLELQSRKVDTADEVPAELGLPIVGALPILPARAHHRGAPARRESDKDRHWRNLLLESVDATRTLLVHAARTGAYRAMMITSAMPGEGKTSLASYLATSLARCGLRTLLIDADLRSPMMHGLFDLPPAPGVCELLRGELDLEQALAPTAVEDLTLLAAGQCDRQALRALAQGGLGPLLDRLKERFDFVLIDTSPILPVADAMLIAQHADAAIFSIFRDVSRKTKVKAACERLQRLGVPVLGAVVTGVHGSGYGNDYYDPYSTYTGLPDSVAVSSTDLS